MPHALHAHTSRRRAGHIAVVLALLAILAGIGLRDPSPPDEPRFALAARTMVETGDWLVPRRGIEPYAEKPPVFMWMQAASLTVVRDARIAFLLPSALAALATLLLAWRTAAWLWSPRISPWATGALAVTLQFGLQAKRAQIDMVLVAMTTFALCAFLRYLLDHDTTPRARRGWLAAGAFAAGLGTVTKGVGFLPLLAFLPWLVARTRVDTPPGAWRRALRDGGLALGAFVAGTAVWLLPLGIALLRTPSPELVGYAHELLFRQTGTRYVAAWHHVQPHWYYLQVIATLWLPGALLLPWLLPAWWHRLRRFDARHVLLVGWALLVLLFFSASPGKREVYLFPALPALCLAAAPLLPALLRRRGVRQVLVGWLVLLGSALAATAASGLAGAGWVTRIAESRGLDGPAIHMLLLTLGALGAIALALAWWQRRHVARALPVFAVALWTAYGLLLAPALDASSSGRALMAAVDAELPPDAELGAIAWREQHLLQAPRGFTEFGWKRPWHLQWRDAARWVETAPRHRWLWLPGDALGPCVHAGQAIAMGRASRQFWWLVPGTAIVPGCTTPPFGTAPEVL